MATTRAVRRLLPLAALATACLTAASLAASPAQAAGGLKGTITWTRTVAVSTSIPGDHAETGTETTTGSLKVALAGISGSSTSGQGTDRAAKYSGTFARNTTESTFEVGTTPICTKNVTVSAKGTGKTAVSGTVASRGSKKAIVVYAQPTYDGTITYQIAGTPGPRCSPSSSGTAAADGDLNPSPEYSHVCVPKGASAVAGSPSSYALVGLWNAKKRAYVFDCTATYKTDDGRGTATVRIKGSVK